MPPPAALGCRPDRVADLTLPPPIERRARAIVLVHGAWVGEWSWSPLLPALEASGRGVYAVSLTGHGTRSHESGPHVTLDHHVADVVATIETHDLSEITLVGHSYGGRVITSAYGQLADRIARMVFLDAHAPLAPDTGQTPERIAEADANGGMLPFRGYDPDPAELGGAAGLTWFMDRVMPQSFATFATPISGRLPDDLPKAYVFASGYSPTRFAHYAAAAEADPAWRYVDLPGSHWLMFSHPDEVSSIILE
jgi:pimeloyl-ACP methyl ester carboxylesterase